jgi:hypothetical protein
MQFFLAQGLPRRSSIERRRVEQGKDTVCEYLRGSAVNKLNHRADPVNEKIRL